jgi:nucleoid-associated protein YgaU
VVVRSGDSLWTIAAGALGPEASDVEIALEWPRWFEANKAAIGANPDVLLPGQILRSP